MVAPKWIEGFTSPILEEGATMAAKRARRRSKKAGATRKGVSLGVHPKFAGNTYDCRGKRVRHRGGGTHPAVYCSRQK